MSLPAVGVRFPCLACGLVIIATWGADVPAQPPAPGAQPVAGPAADEAGDLSLIHI